MKKLFVVTGILGIASLVNLITGLIRAKYMALTLGPEGIGIFSQASYFYIFLSNFGTLGIGLGVNKYVAQNWKEKNIKKTKEAILSSFLLVFLVSFLLIVVALIMAPQLSYFLFASRKYGIYVLMLTASLPFVVSVSLFTNIFFSLQKIKSYTKAKIISLISGLVFLFILVYLLKLKGAFLYLVLNGIIMGLIFFIVAYRELPKTLIDSLLKRPFIQLKEILFWWKKYFNYGAAILTSTVIGLLTVLFLRATLIRKFGPESNGIYQVVFALSGYYLPFLTNGLWGYFFPRMSTFNNKDDIINEINNTFRLLIILIVPSIITFYILRNLFIKMVFSSEFLTASSLFSWQLSGDFFFLLLYVLNTSLISRAFLKEYLLIGIGYNLSLIIIFFSTYRTLGIKAIVLSYLLSSIILFLINFIIHKYRIGFKLYSKNYKLIILSLLLIIFCMIVKDSYLLTLTKITLMVGWFLMIVKKEEIQNLKSLLFSKYSRSNTFQ